MSYGSIEDGESDFFQSPGAEELEKLKEVQNNDLREQRVALEAKESAIAEQEKSLARERARLLAEEDSLLSERVRGVKNFPICYPLIEFNFKLVRGHFLKRVLLWGHSFFFFFFFLFWVYNFLCSFLVLFVKKVGLETKLSYMFLSFFFLFVFVFFYSFTLYFMYWNFKRSALWNLVVVFCVFCVPFFLCLFGMIGLGNVGFGGFVMAFEVLSNGWFPFVFLLACGFLWMFQGLFYLVTLLVLLYLMKYENDQKKKLIQK